jgi:hypothetical protein
MSRRWRWDKPRWPASSAGLRLDSEIDSVLGNFPEMKTVGAVLKHNLKLASEASPRTQAGAEAGGDLTAKQTRYAKGFSEIRSRISRGSRFISLGAHGKSAEPKKNFQRGAGGGGPRISRIKTVFQARQGWHSCRKLAWKNSQLRQERHQRRRTGIGRP